ncbi:acetyl-CoA C-acyltransferase [Erythrobacteraceae bacterium CFH 75059]|uniref:acetyl-CoA C-acetyltransferase n=1 Tax=Qipengyuania thermophila TaxID=2509361 RepID=UPI00101F89C8|nr:acetyl-CoA C-acetyltransferase [Qipengyuania thermophila]TCD04095.1 acetyl-CoA C-acyltransferase [Erythrobacteraceae bacterium CFH 75059]
MEALRDVVICAPLRTPVGRFGGALRPVPAQTLGAHVVRAIMERTALPPDAVGDVIFAQCYPSMEAPALGRVVALDAGLPDSVPGMQVDRRCGSGLQAVILAAMTVATGGAELVIAGGAESMSNAPHFSHAIRWGVNGHFTMEDSLHRGRVTAGGKRFPISGGMIETAENLRERYAIGREAQDALALESHRRAVAAQEAGRFDDEIVPITVTGRKETVVMARDEHPRAGLTDGDLARLRPLMAEREGATVTAGNASGQNDGAAAAIVCTRSAADRHGLEPLARVRGWAVTGVAPALMGLGPVAAGRAALERAGLGFDSIDLIELNEAFAVQVLAVLREWGLGEDDQARLNVNGSGISLGHPLAATGARILATLLHELKRRDARYGLETLCIGGGQGIAAVFERVS